MLFLSDEGNSWKGFIVSIEKACQGALRYFNVYTKVRAHFKLRETTVIGPQTGF